MHMVKRLPPLVIAISGLLSPAQSLPPSILIEHVRVFDGRTAIPPTDVFVENGRIAAVGGRLTVPQGVRRIDGSGKTLLPGFIDAHTHTLNEAGLRQPPIFGVTTTLDMFTAPGFA